MTHEYWRFVNKLSQDIESALGSALVSTIGSITANIKAHTADKKQALDCMLVAMCGRQLSDAQIAEVEKDLETNPNQLNLRIALLGKYGDFQYSKNIEYRRRRVEHIAWIIQNRPECPIAGTPFALVSKTDDENKAAHRRLKTLWLEQCSQPEVDVPVLLNAASFFQSHNKKVAEKCLNRALKKQPLNKSIRTDLVQLYSLWEGHETEALANLEMALMLSWHDSDRLHLLERLPAAALAAGSMEKATKAAEDLLLLTKKFRDKGSDNCGDAIHEGHTVLGLIAMKKGDIKTANFHLALSVAGVDSPVLGSFGPSLDLAKELVDAGERDVVLQFLDRHEELCGPFNDRAFELRYRIQLGKKRSDDNFDEFTQAYLDRQIQVLRSHADDEAHPRESRMTGQIHLTRMSIDSWSERYDEEVQAENYEAAYYADKRRRLYETHLAKLQSL